MMNDKIKELVERVAKTIQDRDADAGECYTSWDDAMKHTRDYYRETARQVLSNPDLARIDREKKLPFSLNQCIELLSGVLARLDMPFMTEEYQVLNFAISLLKKVGTGGLIPLAEALKEG